MSSTRLTLPSELVPADYSVCDPGSLLPVAYWNGYSIHAVSDGSDCRHVGYAAFCYADGDVGKLMYDNIHYPPPGVAPANFRLWHYNAQ